MSFKYLLRSVIDCSTVVDVIVIGERVDMKRLLYTEGIVRGEVESRDEKSSAGSGWLRGRDAEVGEIGVVFAPEMAQGDWSWR